MDIDAVARDIAEGRISEEHLSWQDYQQLVSEIIRRQNLEVLASSEVTISDNEFSGEIDIVIQYAAPKILIAGERQEAKETIFVECKRRKRKLELDDVGKVFCYSMLQQPASLYIISPRPLSPQAISCAQRLFDVDRMGTGFFKTRFAQRTLRQLLDPPGPKLNASSKLRLEAWSLTLEEVFHSTVVADDSHYAPVIDVPAGSTVRLHAVLRSDDNFDVLARLYARHGCIAELEATVSQQTTIEFRFRVGEEPTLLREIEIIGPGETTTLALPRVELERSTSDAIFGDLRAQEAARFASGLASDVAPKITAITGEPGIGKSYFCESVARYVKERHQYDVLKIVVTPRDEYQIFVRMLRHFFIPVVDTRFSGPKQHSSDAGSSHELSIVSTALSQLSGAATRLHDVSELLARVSRGEHNSADPADLLGVLSGVIRASPRPHLIVLTDCHLMSAKAVALLRSLIGLLDSEGWGKTRLILEHRPIDRALHPAWYRAERELTSDLGARFGHVEIKPLTLIDMIERVASQIEAPSPQLTAEVLLRQAGGNPLFLEHVMRLLLDARVLLRDDSGGKTYRVDHFELFQQRIEVLPQGIEDFLCHRVMDVLARSPVELQGAMAAYLGLTAVITSSGASTSDTSDTQLLEAIESDERQLRRVRHRLTAGAILMGTINADRAEFVHDLMLLAALSAVKSNTSFRDAALVYLDFVDPATTSSALVAGRLSEILGELSQAVAYFESGLTAAEVKANFLEQRKCLEGIRGVLMQAPNADVITSSRRLNTALKLIWNELQQGSQYAAERFIEQARTELRVLNTPELKASGIGRYVEQQVSRYQVVLDTRRADVSRFVADCRHYIETVQSADDLHYAATRLVLMALHACDPSTAVRAAQIAAQALGPEADVNMRSSLSSDLGHFFLLERPELLRQLWRFGLEIFGDLQDEKVDVRQKFHALVNDAIAEAVCYPNMVDVFALESLLSALSERGLTNHYLRLQNCFGVVLFHRNRFEEATLAWERGLQTARASSTQLYEWPYCHNLALASLRDGDLSSAISWQRRCAKAVEHLLPFVGRRDVFKSVSTALSDKATQLLSGRRRVPTLLGISVQTFASIKVSGGIVRFVHAARAVERQTGGDMYSDIIPRSLRIPRSPSLSVLMDVRYGPESLSLAVQ